MSWLLTPATVSKTLQPSPPSFYLSIHPSIPLGSGPAPRWQRRRWPHWGTWWGGWCSASAGSDTGWSMCAVVSSCSRSPRLHSPAGLPPPAKGEVVEKFKSFKRPLLHVYIAQQIYTFAWKKVSKTTRSKTLSTFLAKAITFTQFYLNIWLKLFWWISYEKKLVNIY